ncbi:MAG: hypothetical protein ACO3JL_18215 [Myxococcota bacterium]
MPRSARDLFLALGATLGNAANELVVEGEKLRLPALAGGTLAGEIVVNCFTDDAFGFRAPAEIAGLGVLWAQNLEHPRDLASMVRDGVERHHRRLRQELSSLQALGFATWFSATEGRPCGAMDLDDTRVEVMLSASDELLLLQIDGEPVQPSKRHVLPSVSTTSSVVLIDRLAAHVERVALAAALESELGDPLSEDEPPPSQAAEASPQDRRGLSATARTEIAALLADENDSE